MSLTFSPRRGGVGNAAPSARADAAPPTHVDDEPLTLPDAWTPPPRPPLPLVASSMPILGAVVLWLVTGSVLALLLAGLGPLIAVASLADARRGMRREKAAALASAEAARERVVRAVTDRHASERSRRDARHPDVRGFVERDEQVWRRAVDRGDMLVVGRGGVPSGVRVTGGAGDPPSAAVRVRAATLDDAPVVVAASAGCAVIGAGPVAEAVHRALVLQVCLANPPGELQIVGEQAAELSWIEELPHRRVSAARTLAVTTAAVGQADSAIAVVPPGSPLPPGFGALLRITAPHAATLDHAGVVSDVHVEAIGLEQAEHLARDAAERARRTLGVTDAAETPVALSEILSEAPEVEGGSLAAVIGRTEGRPVVVDLVGDGPHAVVAGVTGSGKSELLITWIVALAATHSTREVSFLLADFKGGTAFDLLRDLPHVTGVITDLDGSGARRAIESLRAELRWRESELSRVGARDIRDPRVELPRLVVVVDEFAALLSDHPELHAVFADIAARGRALGLHLILGTQRVTGVVRDSLLANCPLRISLRVTDPHDSRAVVGTDEASELPGGVRGLALVRRGQDAAPRRTRIALTSADDIARATTRARRGPAPRRPWLPELPRRVSLTELTELTERAETAMGASSPAAATGGFIVGLADEPARQRQRVVTLGPSDRGLLVVGGPGAGRSTTLRTIASQARDVVRVPASGEGAWDAVTALAETPPPSGAVVVVDDLDTIAARFPPDHAQVVLEGLERVFRGAGEAGILVVASAQRVTGAAARLGELLPRRLVLATASRADHIAAGGDPAQFDHDAPPGRGHLDRIAVQVALPDGDAGSPGEEAVGWPGERGRFAHGSSPDKRAPGEWTPTSSITGLVVRRRSTAAPALDAWAQRGIRIAALADYVADPSLSADGPLVIVGDPDEWQREWRLLASVRADHDFVVDAGCLAEYRALTGSRTLPPYAERGARRAWLHRAGGDAVRIVLPGGELRPDRRAWSH